MNSGPSERRRSVGRRLTDRQAAVLELVGAGYGNKAIAHELGISEQAVKEQVSTLLRRLDARNRAALGEIAATRRFVGTEVDPAWIGLLFQRAPMYVALLTRDLRFAAVNEVVRRTLTEDPIGQALRAVRPDLVGSAIMSELETVIATGASRTIYEFPLHWDRGAGRELGYATMLLEAIRTGEAGEVVGVAAFGFDVTDLVRARHAVRDLTEQQVAILEQLPSGVITIDLHGRITNLNSAGRTILRVDASTVATTDAWGLVELHDDADRTLPVADRPLHRALHGATVDATIFIAILRDGARVPLRIRAAPLFDEQGAVRGAVGVFADTTQDR